MHEIIEETGDNDVDGAAGHAHDDVIIRTLREEDLEKAVAALVRARTAVWWRPIRR